MIAMNERPDAITIEHLSVRWFENPREAHTPATHLRVERWVNEVDFTPPGLRPGEILIVDRLVGFPTLANTPRTQLTWQRALQRYMADRYRSAARPVHGRVPAGAASIVFADGAELLLCLVRDVLTERALTQWYWQRLLRASIPESPGTLLTAGFVRYVTALPAAVSQLTTRELVQVGSLLSPHEAAHVLRTIHQQYTLPGPELALWLDLPPPSPSFAGSPSQESLERDAPTAPWSVWLPKGLAEAVPLTSVLVLGISLALHHAPARVRTAEFSQAVAAWWVDQQRVMGIEWEPPAETQPPSKSQPRTEPDQPPFADVQDIELAPPLPVEPDSFHTNLSGVLYLINVLVWLDLPHGYDEEFFAQVGAWALVEALARGLLGDALIHDPLWAVLAALDRRDPGTLAAADLPVPDAFRLPAQWLARFGPSHAVWTAHLHANRLVLVDTTAGYIVIDVPRTEQTPDEQIQAEIAAYESAGGTVTWQWAYNWPERKLPNITGAALGPGLGWWLARVISFVHDLLTHALGPDLTPQAMLCEPGHIVTSRTHVDLYLSLERIRLPVRRIGLDQNPGWAPDLGYIVLFHFV